MIHVDALQLKGRVWLKCVTSPPRETRTNAVLPPPVPLQPMKPTCGPWPTAQNTSVTTCAPGCGRMTSATGRKRTAAGFDAFCRSSSQRTRATSATSAASPLE